MSPLEQLEQPVPYRLAADDTSAAPFEPVYVDASAPAALFNALVLAGATVRYGFAPDGGGRASVRLAGVVLILRDRDESRRDLVERLLGPMPRLAGELAEREA